MEVSVSSFVSWGDFTRGRQRITRNILKRQDVSVQRAVHDSYLPYSLRPRYAIGRQTKEQPVESDACAGKYICCDVKGGVVAHLRESFCSTIVEGGVSSALSSLGKKNQRL